VWRPRSDLIGWDFSGTVEAAGDDVADLRPGEDVFGAATVGAFAEYVSVRDGVAPKPANLTFEEAAALPMAAVTALQGVRDHGQLQPGRRVLINGASGGVGTFAVQIAKAFEADVTAVCSTRNVETVRSLGADRVIDYTRDDFTRTGERYDLIFDVAGSRSWSACRRVLGPGATLVMAGAPMGKVLGPLGHLVLTRLASMRGSQKFAFFTAKVDTPALSAVRDLVDGGKVMPVIERRYDLSEIADAFRHMSEGHASGKLVVTL
jgi:NADPH:quinone reductase-like Zn-dependent oxidoreductase